MGFAGTAADVFERGGPGYLVRVPQDLLPTSALLVTTGDPELLVHPARPTAMWQARFAGDTLWRQWLFAQTYGMSGGRGQSLVFPDNLSS